LKKSVLNQPQNSRDFFAPGPRRSLAMLQPLRRSWVDFHMTTTTPSYEEYKKSIRTQIKTRPRQEPTFSTALGESGHSASTYVLYTSRTTWLVTRSLRKQAITPPVVLREVCGMWPAGKADYRLCGLCNVQGLCRR
jgi:hypothetical protein